jgi:hypothetical protein
MIIFWLIIPDFGRASYVYNKLIHSMKPQIVSWGLNSFWKKWFFEKDNFLMHAERYMKENGTEALEKLIASKVNSYVALCCIKIGVQTQHRIKMSNYYNSRKIMWVFLHLHRQLKILANLSYCRTQCVGLMQK